MKYQVVVFPSAERDLLEIRTYFEEILVASADSLIDKIYEALVPLTTTPFMYPLVHDDIISAKGFHFITVDSYIIFYKISGETVQIHRVLYGRRLYNSII